MTKFKNRHAHHGHHGPDAWHHDHLTDPDAMARYGPPPGFGPPSGFGPPPGFGPPWMRGRGGRSGGRPRGDIRSAILVLLGEQPRHGYDLIKAIEERSEGFWTPSAGSIYPTLQALEDEGLITIESIEGRKTASLTAAGRAWLDERPGEEQTVFAKPGGSDEVAEVMHEFRALAEAARHAAHTPALAAQAAAILATARKDIYRLLADADS